MSLLSFVGWFATATTIAYFLATGLQARTIFKNKAVGETSFYPFAATYLNCMLWLKYGVYASDSAVVIVNGFGAIVAFLSMIIYYWYSHDKPETEKRAIQALGLLMIIFLLVRFKVLHPKWVGVAAMVASVLMFAAPLVVLVQAENGPLSKSILKRRDSSVLSLPTVLATLGVSSSWTIYGLLREDVFIIVPNMLGTILSVVQLTVLFKFKPSSGQAAAGSPRAIINKDRTSYEYIGS